MAERLREVADLPPARDVVLLGEQAEVVGQPEQPLEQRARLVDAAVERERVDQPERAGEELALVAGQAVVGLPPSSSARRSRRGRARAATASIVPGDALVVAGQEADERDVQDAGVELARAVVLGERAALAVVAALADLRVDLVADRASSAPAAPPARTARRAARRGRTRPRP